VLISTTVRLSSIIVVLVVAGCATRAEPPPLSSPPGGKADDDAEQLLDGVLTTDVSLDLESLEGRAVLRHAPAERIALEVGGLELHRVLDEDGGELAVGAEEGVVVLEGDPDVATTFTFEYAFTTRPHGTLEGYVAEDGVSFTWPYFCGNLFPCVSRPRDGARFGLSLSGVPEGSVAVHPASIPSDAPAYMLAFAVGDYEHELLGTTAAGTDVSVYYYRGEAEAAHEGVADLVAVFGFLEETYGPYLFGDDVASVSADWGPGDYGGMEHHPYFHVGRGSMTDPITHAHEAAHGWFGNGVRIRCWEDFVLSEGTTSYLAARALAAAGGEEVEAEVWAKYEERLQRAVAYGDTVAWPQGGCDEIDILTHPVWSSVPYMKGAFFLRAVESEVGTEALDEVLAAFYRAHGGREAASVSELLDAIEADTGFDPGPLAEAWLLSLGVPERP
jgi:hypothetical protein